MSTTTAANLHRLTAQVHPDTIDSDAVPARLAAEGMTLDQWQDVYLAMVTARATGSVAGVTTSGGITFRASRGTGGMWHVAAVVPERDAIQRDAAQLLRLLDSAVPSSTIHYAVEDARRALKVLADMAPSIITQSA